MNSFELNQKCNCRIIQTAKSVEWLVENTRVKTFDKVEFKGYQRQVTPRHVQSIVTYIENNDFYFPTSIICSCDESYNDKLKLYVVDGQHRIEAFKEIKKMNTDVYASIKDYQLSVIVLENPSLSLEVDTFITINKTAKKVDTSLALLLKNMLNRERKNDKDITTAKKEYIAVELAIDINEENNPLWANKIIYEGNPRSANGKISLNSFVRSTRILVDYLDKYKIINLEWKDEQELNLLKDKVKSIYLKIWEAIAKKWPQLLYDHDYSDNVLQGNIGVAAITKYLVLQLAELNIQEINVKEFILMSEKWITGINVTFEKWLSGGDFAGYSSGSGQNLVAKALFDSYI